MEGNACYNPSSGCNDGTLTLPILDYTHQNGDCTVIGGYRYRGTQAAGLGATYIYGDYCTGRIWGATKNGQLWGSTLLLDLPFLISTFGEDQGGELYVAEYAATGAIYRIKDAVAVSLTVNGSAAPITVTGGTTVNVGIQNGPGNGNDCVSLYQVGAPDGPYLSFMYVSGRTTLPFTMPSTTGTYEFRFFQNCSIPRIAISPPVTVQ